MTKSIIIPAAGRLAAASLLLMAASTATASGPFAPAAGQPGSTAVPANSPLIQGWASEVVDYSPGGFVDLQFQTPQRALGPAGNSDGTNAGHIFDVVSLGRGGSITLRFDTPLRNGPGFDFAVFENAFSDTFLELGWVEVSSDGVNFFRFPGFSLTPGPVGAFGAVDPTNVEGLAGKYRAGLGTPFDLEVLADTPGLDVSRVPYVRIVDIVGDGSAPNDLNPQALADYLRIPIADLHPALFELASNAPAAIFDPFPTVGSAGFDLDAVAALNVVPLPAAAWLMLSAIGLLVALRRRALAKSD